MLLDNLTKKLKTDGAYEGVRFVNKEKSRILTILDHETTVTKFLSLKSLGGKIDEKI